MSQDQQTYKRGRTFALWGLIVQAVLSVLMGVLALAAQSPTVDAVFWHFVVGLGIWLTLLLLYNQHVTERAQTLEAEKIAQSDAVAARLFDEAADDLDLARRRLRNLYQFGLRATSVITATLLLGLGGGLFWVHLGWWNNAMLAARAFNEENLAIDFGVLAGLLFAVAFVCFLVARAVSGMTRQREWRLLRGGASYLMGNLVTALLASGGALMAYGFDDRAMGYLSLVIPGMMFLVGLEMLTTFLLSLYRPRRVGEIPRPAFDSRVLGILTAPESIGRIISEAINYQFGIEVSQSWFYQLLSRSVGKLIGVGALALLLISCLVLVRPHEQAVILHFGDARPLFGDKPVNVVKPGPHFKLPWPLGTVEKYEVNRVQTVSVGSIKTKNKDVAVLWTNEHSEGEEDYMVVAPTRETRSAGDESGGQGSGVALMAAELVVQYQIDDLALYLESVWEEPQRGGGSSPSADRTVRTLASQAMNRYLVTQTIDDLLGEGRSKASQRLQQDIQALAHEHELGINITFAGVVGAHPPQKEEVAQSFHEVVSAQLEKQTRIEQAKTKAAETLTEVAGTRTQALMIRDAIRKFDELEAVAKGAPDDEEAQKAFLAQQAKVEQLLMDAQGKASEILMQAQADRWEHQMNEWGRAERYAANLAAYQTAPRLYMNRLYLDTLAETMDQSRKVIIAAEHSRTPTIRWDLKDAQNTFQDILEGDE